MLASDFSRLPETVAMVNASEADWFHLDVMDGRFVPNITFGMLIVDAIRKLAEKPLDVHLMIVEPEKYIDQFREAGADVITVHYEACTHLHRVIHQIRETGAQAGVAINPHTPVELLEDILEDANLVCVMAVNPGFGGQKFIHQTINKVRRLQELKLRLNPELLIEIDGGVGLHNAEVLLQAGADVLVAGNSVFASPDPGATISAFKAFNSIKSY